ncbi:MAG: segregation and condensation protein segregation and condensation protein [Candidatus Parcubacteria bacterium]|jgi:segregation and condensation protein A
MEPFKIKTEQFEGPLDLLLNLIEKRKLHINDIALAKVTDDFITHLQQHQEYPMEQSAHFILIASTLLLIKSKSLLPTLELTEEESQSIEDLEKRLKEYQRIKELSVHIQKLFGVAPIYWKNPTKREPIFAPDASMTMDNLYETMKSVLLHLPQKKEKLPEAVVRQVISLEDMIEKLTDRVTSGLRMTFKEFSSEHKAEKVNVIVSFLAMLELVKNGLLKVDQQGTFDDIHMETEGQVGTPRYM